MRPRGRRRVFQARTGNKQSQIYYGVHAPGSNPDDSSLDGKFIDPLAAISDVDDVTGEFIPHRYIVFQDGLVKDSRHQKGSIENQYRHDIRIGEVTYNADIYGVQKKASGE